MLHILLSVLKITGIIIAAILGILVLLVCIVLFVPIRYEVKAKCDGTIETLKAKGVVTWILHLIRADFYFKDKKLRWKLRIAWLKKSNQTTKKIRKEEEPNEETKESEKESEAVEEKEEEIKAAETGEKPEEKLEENHEDVQPEEPQNHGEEDKGDDGEASDRISETEEECKAQKETVHQKIDKLFHKIKCTFQNIYGKIKEILEKKEKITDFIKAESHVEAFNKTMKVLFVMIKRLRPKKTEINVRFGFEDPYTTGQVLAGLSMIYPFIGGITEIYPDFEQKVLKGTVYIKGKIRLWHIVTAAVKLLLCKAVRVTYKDFKNFKL